ncbi:DENN (AEX-3) domain-containing protein [Striga hermonthica]|uniref:DENN (AEX-3) domain-containing protein n=1 Tax=Striga hermonthica TaxID=68872 RepID=A0A9N7RCH4_STRHE|nr:DENN (AEX-3) domain-containing protein [Striga hermonthica]
MVGWKDEGKQAGFLWDCFCRRKVVQEMNNDEEIDSPSWGASFIMQTTEDVARAVAAAAAAVRSPRPSVVYSSKDESGSQLHKLQHHVSRLLKGLSGPSEIKSSSYNPEILTSQKRQWANFQLQLLDHRVWKEPSKLFESMVVVGLPPTSDVQSLQNLYFARKFEGPGRFRNALGGQHQSRIEPNLEPQVLFVYPPEKQLPLKYKDLLSFCFPAGVEVNAVEKTPSMSELNEILLGQEHLKQSDLSFVFRLQVADASTLYGCCVLVEEMIQKPSGLISAVSDGLPLYSGLNRYTLTTRRCYCILSRLPFFELHFGVLNSIFMEERLERLTKQVSSLNFETPLSDDVFETVDEEAGGSPLVDGANSPENGTAEASKSSTSGSISGVTDYVSQDHQNINQDSCSKNEFGNSVTPPDPEVKKLVSSEDLVINYSVNENATKNQSLDRRSRSAALPPFSRYQQCESSESSSSYQGSSSEDRHFQSDLDSAETEEASSSGRHNLSEQKDILEWAKANNKGSLQIICEYYQLSCPSRGSTIKFHPLDHLHPLQYRRPDETVLDIGGSSIDLRSCNTSWEFVEAHSELMVEEEAAALSVWAIACLCGSLRLEHVLTLFAGALLEKQILIVCSNLGVLSAIVLSVIPLIRPYHWQSLLMPVLPNDMLDFLDAPVPYIVGVRNKTTEVQAKLTNVIVVDANRNQVKSPTIPQLPQHKELYSCLSPYHAKLVGESYLGKKRPVYDCTDVQVEAAKGFLGVLRSYLDSLCSNLRSHTITNVQSNDDKVSLLLKESFIESFPSRDRPFMKLFVDTQLFSVHTDFVLSFFQKE